VVATPGRLIDLYKEHLVDLKQVRAVVFDEADRMFDMGFKDDMKYLLQRIPNDRQFLVFSATLNFDVLNTAYQFGANPVEVNISRDQAKAENVEDSIFHLGTEDKPKYLLSLMKLHQPKQCVIFSNFKNQIDPLVKFLRANKVPALGISSLLTQVQRNKVLQQFKEVNETQVLVATDVAARGLDIQGIDLVFNYELPQDCETYVHRIGRTGRAGQAGKAFSFVGDRDVDSLVRIEEYLKHKLNVSWLEDKDIITEFMPLYEGSRKTEGHREEHRGPKDFRKPERDGNRDRDYKKGERKRPIEGAEGVAAGEVPNNAAPTVAGADYRSGRYGKNSNRGGESSSGRSRDHRNQRGDSKRDYTPRRDHYASKAENSTPHREKNSGAYHKKTGKTQGSHSQSYPHKQKNQVPARTGVYKINFWFRIVRFFKGIFQ
jgi:ATP-dependent RNA helicase RhlB